MKFQEKSFQWKSRCATRKDGRKDTMRLTRLMFTAAFRSCFAKSGCEHKNDDSVHRYTVCGAAKLQQVSV